MMAQQVLSDGQPYTYVGHLVPSDRVLASKVAAPYTIGPDGTIFVIANEVLDDLLARGGEGARLQLAGRLLEVDDVTYFVATASPRRAPDGAGAWCRGERLDTSGLPAVGARRGCRASLSGAEWG
ncbi:MAG: hypothetical protein R3F59_28865 [Myxococcota bacterium]